MLRPERGQAKDTKQTDAEQELRSQEIERFARSVFGEFPQRGGVPVTENLAEELAAARKRMDAYERGD